MTAEIAQPGTRARELVDAFTRVAMALERTDDHDPPSTPDRLAGLVDHAALVEELAVRCGWGARDIAAPLLPSGVSHGVPWGLSIAPGSSELRIFVEAQRDPPSLAGYWRAACDLGRWLETRGAFLDRWRALVAGIEPSSDAAFRIWHSVVLPVDAAPRWHAYLCIPPGRHAVAVEALQRVGVESRPALRDGDRITIVSLDLVEDARRIKAYVLMPDAAPADLPTAAGRRFARAMLGDDRRIWWLAAHDMTTSTCALHFGVPRHLDEAIAVERVREVLRSLELDRDAWERARSIGPHHFVSFQERDSRPRITTYFLPQVAR